MQPVCNNDCVLLHSTDRMFHCLLALALHLVIQVILNAVMRASLTRLTGKEGRKEGRKDATLSIYMKRSEAAVNLVACLLSELSFCFCSRFLLQFS